MSVELQIGRLTGGTLYKILLVGLLLFHVTSTLVIIIMTVTGILPLETPTAEVPTTGLLAFLGAYLILGALSSPMWVAAIWLSIWPGLWLYSKFHTMQIRYIESGH